jgi:hypothetical protein
MHEILHPIREPIRAAVEFLNLRAQPSQLLVVSYPDMPFIFYTPLRVVGGRSGGHAIRRSEIDWVIVRNDSEKADFPIDYTQYEKIELDVPNYPWGNRPDPDLHVFRTVSMKEPAIIYRRR